MKIIEQTQFGLSENVTISQAWSQHVSAQLLMPTSLSGRGMRVKETAGVLPMEELGVCCKQLSTMRISVCSPPSTLPNRGVAGERQKCFAFYLKESKIQFNLQPSTHLVCLHNCPRTLRTLTARRTSSGEKRFSRGKLHGRGKLPFLRYQSG